MSFRLVVFTAAAVTCILSMSPAAATVPPDIPVPFRVGETLNYDVSWSSFFTAGRATLRVADREPLDGGRSGYVLQAEAQSTSVAAALYKLYYKTESVLDTSTLESVRSTSYSSEGGRERGTSIGFGPNEWADVEMRTNVTSRSTIAPQPRTLDVLSALYVLRTRAARKGDSFVIPIVDGTRVSQVEFAFGALELVDTGFGKLAGRRVTATTLDPSEHHAADRGLTFWLDDYASHKPLRFDIALPVGTVTLTLVR